MVTAVPRMFGCVSRFGTHPSSASLGNRIGFKPIALRGAKIYVSPFTFIRSKSISRTRSEKMTLPRKDDTSYKQGDIDELLFHPPSLEF
jgi:hypothetical protein